MSHSKDRVYARYRPIDRVSPTDVMTMYGIFSRYYEHAPLDTFLRDMSKKTGVFLLRRRSDREIVGFSTVATMDLDIDGKPIIGVFSGDTIIEKEYWGSRALPLAFFIYLVRLVVRHPLTPIFWLLISKGYKTYLLMANNFFRYYPHPEGKYSEYSDLIPLYCEKLFPGYYDPDRKILDFGDQYNRLKDDVARVSDELRSKYPKVAFFEEKNPEWHRGTELPCVGRAGFPDAFRYLFRYLGKAFGPPSAGKLESRSAEERPVMEKKNKIAVPVCIGSSEGMSRRPEEELCREPSTVARGAQ